MVMRKVRRAKRVRLAGIGLSASALAAMAMPIKLATTAEAKTPGSTYCYHGVCHRVKTIEETRALVGVEQSLMASHYDDCSRDRFNPCGLTSSGERFHADRPDNTASPIYPDGTTLLVWNPETERALVVRVNNAGPYWGDRTLDLSRAAAEKLGFEGNGVAKVRVRVIKAPEPEEATYVANRNYPPVPGDIGEYASSEEARTGMAVALALQASAASPLAPVTTANAFARPGAEPLVAEAPQALGRAPVRFAELAPEPAITDDAPTFHLLPQSLRPLHPSAQSRRRVASLSTGHEINQTIWGDHPFTQDAIVAGDNARSASRALLSDRTGPELVVAQAEVEEISVAAPVLEQAVVREAAEPEPKPVVRRAKQEKMAQHTRSAKSQAHDERRSRKVRTARNDRRDVRRAQAAFAARGYEQRPTRTAQQLTTLGLKAQSSSTM